MNTIAIVILNWNGEKLLKQFLPHVIENSKHEYTRVIVADNASTDNSIQLLKTEFPFIETILLDKNYGFAGGYNRALQQIDADYFLLLNSDVLPEKGWIDELHKATLNYPATAIFMPKIKSFKEPDKFEYAGAAGGFIDKYGFPFCRGRIFDKTEFDNNQYNNSSEIFWASGAAFLIKSERFFEEHGLDEAFFAHMEEIDLCWRLKNKGHSIMYIPTSVVFHVGGASLNQSHPYKTYLNFRNNLYLLVKNAPSNGFISLLITRLLLDNIATVKFLTSFEPSYSLAVIKAHLSFYKRLLYFLKKRRLLLHEITENKHNEMYNKSIVFDYFIRKKQKFSQLNFMN